MPFKGHKKRHDLGLYYQNRFQQFGKLEDIEKAIKHTTRALTLTPDGHSDLPGLHTTLGILYTERYQNFGELSDLDKAIEYRHTNLGVSYNDRYQHLSELDDLEKTIECRSHALELTPDNDPDRPDRYTVLAVSHSDRYQRLQDLDDLQKAIEYSTFALTLTPDGHLALPDRHGNLGSLYTDRYTLLGDLGDLAKAIEYYSHAVKLTPDHHQDLSRRHMDLALAYTYRYERLKEVHDLERAIECRSRGITLTFHDDPELPGRHVALGISYYDHYELSHEIPHLDKAIECFLCALKLTPNDHPDLPGWYPALALSYSDRYKQLVKLPTSKKQLSEIGDLDKALECDSRALDVTPENDPSLPDRNAFLGTTHMDRYKRLGERGNLEKAIEYRSRALALTPNDHADLQERHTALGVRLGDISDLEKALECDSRALTLTPDGHPNLPDRQANVASSYSDRYQHLGENADLEKSLEYNFRALSLTPDGHPDLPGRHAAMGVSYDDRYRRLGALSDLEKGLKYKLTALILTPEGHPDLAARHTALGASYTSLYGHLGELSDLEKALECDSRALTLTPDDHQNLPDRHANLGVSYHDRYRRLGKLADLEKAIECHFRALSLTPDGHPDMAFRYLNRATSCHSQYQHTCDPVHLSTSLDAFRKASQLLSGTPRDVFDNALRWASLASKYSHLNCVEAFSAAVGLLPHFIWLGATASQRYQDILSTENLAIRAAASAISSSEYTLALEWLEHARCVVWNQSLALRSPFDILHLSHPDLADQLQSVSRKLNQANSLSFASESATSNPEQRHHLARQYDGLLLRVRQLPGFEDFLQPTKVDGLVKAARFGPVIVINCEDNQCDALLVIPQSGDISHVPLPKFTATKAQQIRLEMERSAMNRRLGERGVERRPMQQEEVALETVLSDLWYSVVKPVLDHLGYTSQVDRTIDDMPHVTWCPTGALSFLPLHAAGDYDISRSRVFDYVISSYTPTLAALLSPSVGTLGCDSRVLVIGQEATPGHQQLPGTAKEIEYVVGHVKQRAKCLELSGSQATAETVLDAMEQHDWVHLACHAHQNVQDPTESGFFLHDGILNLASINQRSFKRKGLAFLSACQTATGDERLPDEAIHLASGMLMAGYSSVIATMCEGWKDWEREAGKALHNAVGELRDKVGEKEFSRWVPYIHIGS
ncbi:TPR-like protein [Rhizoctonia solani]|uniref:TPR-like protein n=1 Tax=Rhizoctonia solani TaxID=456999 RepID=A0A8H7I6J3_9AGAM|nr:TPR-like protein [Rhizoctonia solani]